jgi:hypothetical protein
VHAVVREPSQVPPQAVLSVAQALRGPRGAPATGAQVPLLPVASQASHCPLQLVLQQTPSTQNPLAHWSLPAQATPGFNTGAQTPPAHQSPEMQSVSAMQFALQAFTPHRYGVQAWTCAGGHSPAPLHPAARVALPVVQLGARHEVPAPGYPQASALLPEQAPPQPESSLAQAVRPP